MITPSKSSSYEVYRILQPRKPRRQTGSLFGPQKTDGERRADMIREAVEIGTTQHEASHWVAGSVQNLPNGLMFMVGERVDGANYELVDGQFVAKSERGMNVADVLIDIPTGVMLIYKSRTTPSSYMASLRFKQWLMQANERNDTGFETLVRRVPLDSDFIQEIKEAQKVSMMTFVVHPPNPADHDDIVNSIAEFTQESGLSSATVTIRAEDIDRNLASRISRAAVGLGERVSAYIKDARGVLRTIRTKKKARMIQGVPNPEMADAVQLLEAAKGQLKADQESEDEEKQRITKSADQK